MKEKLDQVVVITGAARGIGKAVAQAYATHGARVLLADVLETEGRAAEMEIKKSGGDAVFQATDVRLETNVQRLMKRAENEFGRIDVLINNAGVSRMKPPQELTIEEWDDVININLRGCFLCAREAVKYMNKDRGGAIVQIASTRALMSEPNSEAYAASKGGIVGLTHALALSFGEKRIRVNCISPGWIQNSDYVELSNADHEQHPSRRVGKPEDIAKACLYLTDPANDFVTGINLVVDGGMTRKMIYEE